MMSPSTAVVFILVCIVVFFGAVVFLGAPYVPSQKKYIKRVLEYLAINADDLVVDIGSGDGVVLREVSRRGARAVGYEINPLLVGVARLLSLNDEQVTVHMQNAWAAKFPRKTTLVYIFSVTRDEGKITTLLQREADRLNKPLKLLCYGSPFKRMAAIDTFEAYHLYIFQPLQPKKA